MKHECMRCGKTFSDEDLHKYHIGYKRADYICYKCKAKAGDEADSAHIAGLRRTQKRRQWK